jgi:hypothetical protein
VIIDATACCTGVIDLTDQGRYLQSIHMPGEWTDAKLYFLGSADGVTFGRVYDENVEYKVNAGSDRHIILDPKVLKPLRFLVIYSGDPDQPVPQGAPRTLNLVAVPAE